LARAYQTARLCQTLGMLVQAGVPLLKALQTATATVGSPYLQQQLQTLMAEVREGAPLGLALERQTELHPLMATFARVGEETGRLPALLLQVSQQLAAEVQRRAMLLATLLEPALILLMGGMVLLIVLAVLTPIMELNTLVRL
jgi:general secretion pathway protein F